MLSAASRPVIEATLPVVGANIVEIATRFYDHMFQENPELLDGIFNRGNQSSGQQRQSLAGSIAVYATFLVERPGDSPEALMTRIAHKHASLGIKPEQYQVVHDNLFWAIVDVLGDAVTPEVAAAWEEVYWLMANALINIERGLYSARGVSADTIWRPWEVAEKVQETPDVVRLVLKRVDDRLVKTSLPGQYVTVQMPMKDGTHQPRQYSLVTADDGRTRTIAVKKVAAHDGAPAGEVSSILHDEIEVGDILVTSLPWGDIVLDDAGRPVVMCSAGIGITPMAGMLSHLAKAESGLPITLLHADLSEANFAMRAQIEHDIAKLSHADLHVFYEEGGSTGAASSSHQGQMDLDAVQLPDNAVYFLCGPVPFMQAVREKLLARGVAPRDIQYEVFGPDLWQADYA